MECGVERGTGRLRFSFNHPLRPIVLPPTKPNVPPMDCGDEAGTGRLRFSLDHPCVRLFNRPPSPMCLLWTAESKGERGGSAFPFELPLRLLWSAESKGEQGGSAFPLTIPCIRLVYRR